MNCVICGYEGDFQNYGKRECCQCPKCLSLERHRSAWYVINDKLQKIDPKNCKVLHVAPTKSLHDALIFLGDNYYPIDINPNNKFIRYVSDVTRLPFPDDYFDLVICLHTLDEVSDDIKAMEEMKRVAKTNSSIIITTYVDEVQPNTIVVDWNKSEEERKKKYGSLTRRRIYGKDVVSRLSIYGITVNVIHDASEEFCGIPDKNEIVYLCNKW